MDFARKHRLHDEADDRPPIIHVASGCSWAALAESASTGKPLEIEPGLGPPPPEFRTVVIDGVPTIVLVETGCAGEGAFAVGVAGGCTCELCVPRPCFRSIWDVYGLRRRPRRS